MKAPIRFMKKGLPAALLVALAISAVACAPQAEPEGGTSNDAGKDGAAMTVEWSPEADCAACHTTEASSREDSTCLASLHVASKCTDCHAATDELAAEHEGKTAEDRLPKRLAKTDVSQDQCLSCHISYEDLAAKTANYQGLVDSEGTVVNPHALPASDDHADIACTDCHAMHAKDADPAKDGKTTCIGCHHADVFACGTCH